MLRTLLACMACGALVAACSPPAPPALPLLPEDFSLSGVPPDMDTTEMRLTFGDPDSIVTWDHPYDSSVQLSEWYYDGFRVQFAGDTIPAGFVVHERSEATVRGIRVGDAARDVLRRYGRPVTTDPVTWTYVDPNDPTGLHVVEFLVRDDTVRGFFVGRRIE